MTSIRINTVSFLNDTTLKDSIGRLGLSALDSGVSSAATAALVRLTCQAHGIEVEGLRRDYLDRHLDELRSLRVIHWRGGDEVWMV